ncbi:MAG: protein kinase [Planctomycetes bacterium]|nr:protein kinase [Planctomycetota bacterium]
MEPFRAAPEAGTDDTPAAPFARPRERGPRPSLELPKELAGGVVADYALELPIGQGGMSWMFRARRPAGEVVALKVLDPALARDQGGELVQRFLREGPAAASVRHPNVVGAVDHGTCPRTGVHYIALDFVDGQTIEDMLTVRGAMPEAEALNVALGVAQALTGLAAAGIVHRDVKPANILLDAAGTPRLADLGVAKLLNAGALTAAGALLGTPHYIAPEQAIGMEQVDARTDLYALGVTLFRMVTGQLPFAGEGFLDVVTRHVNEDLPDPRAFAPEVSADTARLIASLAARDPDDRYPDARAAAEDIARVLLGQEAHGSPAVAKGANGAAPRPRAEPRTARHVEDDGPTPVALPRPRSSPPAPERAAPPPPRPAAQAAGARTRTPPPRQAPPTLRITVRTGSHVLARKKFDQDVITIGREPRCDVHIDNPMVSRHHCEIRRTDGRFSVLERNTTNGTYLGGARLNGERDLRPGDVIGVTKKFEVEVAWDVVAPPSPEPDPAEQTFFDEPLDDEAHTTTPAPGLAAEPAPPPAAGGGRARLIFSRGGNMERQVVEEWFQVGRSPECDLRLESSFAPRKAYVVARGPRAYHLFNVAPYPQTVLVNGRPTDDVAPLRHGDKISAYGTEVVFEVVPDA